MEDFRGADGMVDAAAWRRARLEASGGAGAEGYSVSQNAQAEASGSIPQTGMLEGTVPIESSDWGRLEQQPGNRGDASTQNAPAEAGQPAQRQGWWPFGRRNQQPSGEPVETAQSEAPAGEPGSVEEMQAAYLREAEAASRTSRGPQRGAERAAAPRTGRGPLRAPRRATAPQPAESR